MTVVTRASLEQRLARLEVRALTPPFASRTDSFPPQSPEAIRAVLKMLVEIGALEPPPAGEPDRWQEVRLALFGLDVRVGDGDSQHSQ